MTEWQRRLRRVLELARDEEPLDADSVAAALGLVYANHVLERPMDAAWVDSLRERGRACLARLGREILVSTDPEGEVRMLVGVARAGLSALDGQDAGDVSDFAELFTPEARRVVELLACRLEGVAAARAAAALSRDRPALERARLLARVMDRSLDELSERADEAPRTLRVAAADVRALLDPAQGRVVGRLLDPAIEAVLFEGETRRLALYAAEPAALRLEAQGATTEDMQPGYWLGRLADSTRSLDAKVYCGDRELSFSVSLSD
ncbi:MAG: hypothetical protein GXP55_01100 [Deltaproteobacteria bacterium]|nr:hypothetical protein [Deltaproteobacteria bacterium]